MLIYDFFLEPIAIKFDMWSWENITVPVKNYIAWFIIAYILILMFYLFRVKFKNKLSFTVFIAQLLFFILLNIIF
jgi:putative membrane protein